jgi:hypothetical protein
VIDPFYSTATSTTAYQPNLHDIQFVDVHAVTLAGAKYPGSTNWNDVLNGVNASNLLTNVTLDNVYFDRAPAWGSSSKSSFTGSPNYTTIVIGSGSTSFPIPTTGLGVTVSGSTPGTASSGHAVDCSGAFPSFSSVNPQAPI